METTTIKNSNNTMQFKPGKIDCTYIKEHSMVNLHSYYFSTGNTRFFNSKIKRVLFVYKGDTSNSNIFSKYGYNPYGSNEDLITILIEEVQAGFDTEEKEYKILLLDKTIKHYKVGNQVIRYKDYKTARSELDRLEKGLKLNLDSLNLFS